MIFVNQENTYEYSFKITQQLNMRATRDCGVDKVTDGRGLMETDAKNGEGGQNNNN